MANTFQGHFPDHNSGKDGYLATSPVWAFPPNGYGLYDMAGNVWQWCADWYRPDYYAVSPTHDPQGPSDRLRSPGAGHPQTRPARRFFSSARPNTAPATCRAAGAKATP